MPTVPKKTLPVAQGGTGATTASGARTNIGAISDAEAQAKVDTHNADTTDVHGISDTSALITSSSGTLASRPAASASNAGDFYLATDDNGGTLYRSNGSSWVQAAAGVTAETPWTPDNISGGVYMLADDNPGSSGTNVTTWVDRINGWNFTQATGSKKPQIYNDPTNANTINGEPAVFFDGVDDILVFAGTNLLADQAGSVFVVFKGTLDVYMVAKLVTMLWCLQSTRRALTWVPLLAPLLTPAPLHLTQPYSAATVAMW